MNLIGEQGERAHYTLSLEVYSGVGSNDSVQFLKQYNFQAL